MNFIVATIVLFIYGVFVSTFALSSDFPFKFPKQLKVPFSESNGTLKSKNLYKRSASDSISNDSNSSHTSDAPTPAEECNCTCPPTPVEVIPLIPGRTSSPPSPFPTQPATSTTSANFTTVCVAPTDSEYFVAIIVLLLLLLLSLLALGITAWENVGLRATLKLRRRTSLEARKDSELSRREESGLCRCKESLSGRNVSHLSRGKPVTGQLTKDMEKDISVCKGSALAIGKGSDIEGQYAANVERVSSLKPLVDIEMEISHTHGSDILGDQNLLNDRQTVAEMPCVDGEKTPASSLEKIIVSQSAYDTS